jgi:Family of unknown function (DUF5996)
MSPAPQSNDAWPALPLAEWADSRDTLLLWTQIVGKVRLANTPLVNHWWNVPLYVSARGLTSSLIPYGSRGFGVDLDLLDHQLRISVTDGQVAAMDLRPRTVADFHAEFTSLLDGLGLATAIWTTPVELEAAIPFEEDQTHSSYDPDQVQRFWLALVQISRVFEEFRAEFVGKCSPVHLFWGALDLAVTRFSGRSAPLHPGGAPNCGPHVMHEAYSHEVSSAGFWPGGDGEGLFYSYAYPEPEGYRGAAVGPGSAHFDGTLGEFVLPYEVVRTAADPDATLLEFLRSTYVAAADHAAWDRAALER